MGSEQRCTPPRKVPSLRPAASGSRLGSRCSSRPGWRKGEPETRVPRDGRQRGERLCRLERLRLFCSLPSVPLGCIFSFFLLFLGPQRGSAFSIWDRARGRNHWNTAFFMGPQKLLGQWAGRGLSGSNGQAASLLEQTEDESWGFAGRWFSSAW